MALGVRRAAPEAELSLVPMADGGPGFARALVNATGGTIRAVPVHGPLGDSVTAEFGLLGDGATAVLEMASASGLELVPAARRDPWRSGTFGTGELIRAALDAGVRRILVGIGGSATNDGGIGAAQALGWRFFDERDEALTAPLVAADLERIARVDGSARHSGLARVTVQVACDVTNPLLGPTGASAVYGPQKGATPELVRALDAGLARLNELVRGTSGQSAADTPGAGAAGGLGWGLMVFADATLRRGIELVIAATGLAEKLAGADLCLTGEGSIDGQSAFGKTVAGVAATANGLGVPTVALAGRVGGELEPLHRLGLTAVVPIGRYPASLADSIARTEPWLADAAEQAVRLFLGARLRRS
jgi:glycerate kinase